MIDYISLHNHTSFSIMGALVKPSDLFQRAKDLGQNAIAVTDSGTMAGMWDCLKAADKIGIKFIAGCEFYFVNNVDNEGEQLRHIILLAKNAIGYKNLLLLNRRGYDKFTIAFKRAVPRIDWNLLKEYSEGLICTTGCGNGIISQLIMQKDFDGATKQLQQLKDIFGDDLAVELQPHALVRKPSAYSGEVDQRFINLQLTKLSQELDIRAIVTTNSHYLEKDHHRAHDVLLAIGSGHPLSSGSRLKYNVPEFHVKSAIEVGSYFTRLKGLWTPEFIQGLFENTVYFANKCEHASWIDPKYSNPSGKELPEFPVQKQPDYEEFLEWKKENQFEDLPDDVAYLRYCCYTGYDKRIKPDANHQEYKDRLKEELDVIEYHGFSSYMLIVADYIDYARKNGIRVSSGRGSVGGSLIAYLLGIHEADPIKYKLIFARFHNKAKTSFPDIDTDFSPTGRAKVQDYIRRKYGEDYVAHVSNVNTITPKVYVRDISRTFQFGDAGSSEAAKIGDAIADTIPGDVKTIKSALEEDKAPLFAEYAEQYPELAEFADTIAGRARAWSTHAGGLIIGKRPLSGLIPLRRDKDGSVAIEYDKERAEDNGLVKMDTLGLETLDIISHTYEIIKSRGKELPPDPPPFDEYDKETYDLIGSGNTFCVFQLSGTAISVCKAVKPKSIEEISYINALVRPSAKTIVQDFIDTRDGKKPVELMHPLLQRAFGDTYGFGLYEECLLYLAQDVAGWDLHSADRLRKLTKEKGKNPKKVKQWRQEFIDDAQKNKNLSKEMATKIWDEVVSGFGGYGFNLSHSTLYSMISYHTAYLKAHYPLEFLVANLMSEVHSNAKISKENIIRIKDEIRALGVRIVAPDINTSDTTYKIIDNKTLMTGLDSLKYMGKDAIPEILSKRPFSSFEDFLSRVDGRKVQARAIQALAASGCLDSFGLSRKQMFLYASDFKKKLQVYLKKSEEKRPPTFDYPWPKEDTVDWSSRDKFALEEYYMGEGVSGTLNERFEGFFEGPQMRFTEFPKYFKYKKIKPKKKVLSDKEKEDFVKKQRKENTYNIYEYNLPPIKGILVHAFVFKVKKEDSPIRGQTMARITLQDQWGNELSVIAFPQTWEELQQRVKERSGGKDKFEPGIALHISGSFQYESEHVYSFIIDDIYDHKPAPALPEDLKAKKVKMPRAKKSKKDLEKLDNQALAEELAEELIEEGISTDDDDEQIDPFDF